MSDETRYGRADLEALPTLRQVNGDELKVDTGELRYWLTAHDTVLVERLMRDEPPDRDPGRSHAYIVTDRWRTVGEYPAGEQPE